MRADLGAVDALLLTFDGVVMLANTFVDLNDHWHWAEKIESVLTTLSRTPARSVALGSPTESWPSTRIPSAIVAKYARNNYGSCVKLMIGEAAFHGLHVAVTAYSHTVGARPPLGA